MERVERRLGILTHHGRRHRQPRGNEPHAGQILVDARLQRSRRVEHAPAGCFDAVQHVHAEDDLLQRARRHGTHDHRVEFT